MAILATTRLNLPKTTAPGDQPLTLPELAAIWRAIPEDRRFSFVLALDEGIADRLIEYTVQQSAAEEARR